MGFQNDCIDSKYKKHVCSLRKPATQAKSVLKDALQKSQKRFSDQADKLETGEEKNRLLKKLHKITEDLQILESLNEDDIIEFALTTTKKLMAVASNPRLPKELRMKARVASHKPLSSHLARVKSLVEAGSDQSESEAEDDTGVTLDRAILNNQIVKMRGDIKRSKVHLIHKFTRTVKLLQNSKKKEEKKIKCQRKAERLVKKIKHIKEVEADDVSRFALSTKTEDVEKLLADVKIPMKSQAMATITLQKFVAASVEDFRKRFPDWNKTVPSLLKERKKKRKLNLETLSDANKKLRKDTRSVSNNDRVFSDDDNDGKDSDDENEISDNENNGGSDNEEHSINSGSENEEEVSESYRGSEEMLVTNEEDSESGSNKDEEEDESDEEVATENYDESGGENKQLSSSNEELPEDSKSDIEESMVKNAIVKKPKRHLELPKSQTANKKLSKTTVISHKKSNTVVEKKSNDKKSSIGIPLKSKIVKEKPKVVDPFFMTTTNEEYLTSQVPIVTDDNTSNWKSKSDDFNQTRFDKFSNRNKWDRHEDDWKQNKFSNRESQYNHKPFVQRSENTSFNNGSEPFNIFTNRKERRKALQQPPQEEKVEKLHPSWEAKKKQTSIASFQGKKITFD